MILRLTQILRSSRPPPTNFTQIPLSASSSAAAPYIPSGALQNLPQKWDSLTMEDQHSLWRGIESLQKKDWRLLSPDEKRAAWFISFGPYGPREPLVKKGDTKKTVAIIVGGVVATGLVFWTIRRNAPEMPHTMSKEYQEKMNEFERENKMNPITGTSSKDYKGKGHVQ